MTVAKKITSPEQAIAILVGGGVKVDIKKKVQIWTLGMTISPKMAKAGAILDAMMIPDGTTVKPEWRTKWVHSMTCTCDSCAEHILAPIKKSLPVQKKAAQKPA